MAQQAPDKRSIKKILMVNPMRLFLHSQIKKQLIEICRLHWFKRSVGQGVKTPPFHGGITGSIPVRSTGKGKSEISRMLKSVRDFLFCGYDKCLCD